MFRYFSKIVLLRVQKRELDLVVLLALFALKIFIFSLFIARIYLSCFKYKNF